MQYLIKNYTTSKILNVICAKEMKLPRNWSKSDQTRENRMKKDHLLFRQ